MSSVGRTRWSAKIVPRADDGRRRSRHAVAMNSANSYWPLGRRDSLRASPSWRVLNWLSFMRVRPAI
jgi:hypothetical protein